MSTSTPTYQPTYKQITIPIPPPIIPALHSNDVHDVGGYLEGHPERASEAGLRSLRTARVIQVTEGDLFKLNTREDRGLKQ